MARPNHEDDDDPLPARRRPAPGKLRRAHDQEDEEDEHYENDGGVSTLIPYKNSKALLAYYLGVFGLIPCLGNFLGPAALILGILGRRHAQKHPKAKGTGHALTGIVLGTMEILLYWVAPIAYLVIGTFVNMAKR